MKPEYRLTNAELKLAELLWASAPLPSMEMVHAAEQAFGWKKSTTFSVLKVLIQKGVAQNENAVVTTRCTRAQFLAGQSRRYVEETFGGSLPVFLSAFFGGKPISPEQAAELRRLIDQHEGGDDGG